MRKFRFITALAISVYLLSLTYVLSFSSRVNLPKHADAILVLGAKVNLDNTPSEALYNRTLEAVSLFKDKKADYLITTGGVGLGAVPEARVAAMLAKNNGVPMNKILSENDSHNTFENVTDIISVAKKNHINSLIVVSDQFHIARGVFVARHLGFDPVYWDFPNQSYYKNSELIWNYAREAAAMIFYVPKILLTQG